MKTRILSHPSTPPHHLAGLDASPLNPPAMRFRPATRRRVSFKDRLRDLIGRGPLPLLLLAFAASVSAQDLARFVAKPGGGSKVTIEGTSTIHDWTMEGSIIGGFIEIDPKVADPAAAPAAGKVNAKVDVLIPVRSLKSGKQTMDNVYCDAMNEAKYSRITYKLKELSLKEAGKANEKLTLESTGDLTVSGTTNEIKMAVTIERMSADKMKITGSIPIRMTSFGVKPPEPIAFALKTGDEVKLGIEWVVEKRLSLAALAEPSVSAAAPRAPVAVSAPPSGRVETVPVTDTLSAVALPPHQPIPPPRVDAATLPATRAPKVSDSSAAASAPTMAASPKWQAIMVFISGAGAMLLVILIIRAVRRKSA